MNVWQQLAATCTPGGFTPPQHHADPGTLPMCDILGTFPIPTVELRTAERLGVDDDLLDRFFPRATQRIALSRGAPYYQIDHCLSALPLLADASRRLQQPTSPDLPALKFAMVENLHNLLAAAAYRLWEAITDHPDQTPTSTRRTLAAVIDAAICLSGGLAGTQRLHLPVDDVVPACMNLPGPFRTFRELDSQWKISHELGYLLDHHIDPNPDLRALVVPLYGSLSLGLAVGAALRARPHLDLSVHFLRLGFHDLGHLAFLTDDGDVNATLTAPPQQHAEFTRRVAGHHVLIVDDNVGRGSTLNAARALVEQEGGWATTRSVETAWHLYHRSGDHDISAAADHPSLRPNLHYTLQTRLVGHLLRGDITAYLTDPVHTVRGLLRQQMRATLDLAHSVGHWTQAQLASMRTEFAHATLAWPEPAVPEPPTPGQIWA